MVTMAQNLEFADETYRAINVLSRDYGLMRVPERSATPYPRTSLPIDADTLRNRLTKQRSSKSIEAENNDDATMENKVNVDSSETLRLKKPHTERGLSVDFKQLTKSTESTKKPSRQITLPQRNKSSSTRSSYNQHLLSIGTPHPSKKIALNPKVLLNRLNEVDKQKKVKILIPANSWSTKDSKSTVTSSVDSQCSASAMTDTQSFHQHRKLFDMNEFNIAKNGKKLSEIPMCEVDNQLNTDYLSEKAHIKAVNDMKEYLNKYENKLAKRSSFIEFHGHLRSLSFDSQPTTTTEDTTQYSEQSKSSQSTEEP